MKKLFFFEIIMMHLIVRPSLTRNSALASSMTQRNPPMPFSRSSKGRISLPTPYKLADNAIATYNLAHQMAMSPQSLYQPFISFQRYWTAVNQAANTYGNSRSVDQLCQYWQ